MNLTASQLKRVARAACRNAGKNPDELVGAKAEELFGWIPEVKPIPRWMAVQEEIRAHYAISSAIKEVLGESC
jgi:hypothetical protein